ncbi:MAG: DnaJ domain-containing protein [Phycisphaerales bacterium JB040]
MFKSRDEKYHHLRAATRFNTEGFTCREGCLADLSATGMRIRFEGKPDFRVGDNRDFLVSANAQTVRLPGQVVWVKRSSLFSKEYQAGIHFNALRPELMKAIEAFAMHGVIDPAVAPKMPRSTASSARHSSEQASVRVEVPTHYQVLGVSRSATDQQIHEAYRRLAKKLHPDVNKAPDAAQQFKALTAAYHVLKDPQLRTQYDLSVRAA